MGQQSKGCISALLLMVSIVITPTQIISQNNNSQTWNSANLSLVSSQLSDVEVVDNQIIFMAGSRGAIIKSADGGETFTNLSLSVNKSINTIEFIDTETGWIGASYSSIEPDNEELIMKTTDGGQTWTGITIEENIQDIHFTDNQNGWAAANDGAIYHTENGGESWTEEIVGSENLYTIAQSGASSLIAGGEDGQLYKYDMEEEIWSAIDTDITTTITGLTFLEDGSGYLCGYSAIQDGLDIIFQSSLYKTTDEGDSWTDSGHSFNGLVTDVEVDNQSTVVLSGGSIEPDNYYKGIGKIYVSTDQATSFSEITDEDGPLRWNKVHSSDNNWFAVGLSGSYASFTAQSQNLSASIITGNSINDIAFADDEHGVFVTGSSGTGHLYNTTDGGETWSKGPFPDGIAELNAIEFIDTQTGWVVGLDPYYEQWMILKTEDQGRSWTMIDPGMESLRELYDVQFISSDTGYILGNGLLLKTEDAGDSWSEVTSPESFSFFDLNTFEVLSGDHVVVAGDDGLIAETTDGGSSWQILRDSDSSLEVINDISFVDETTGFTVTEAGDIEKTTDGGSTWNTIRNNIADISTLIGRPLTDIFIQNTGTIWFVGDSGAILSTSDLGETFSFSVDFSDQKLTTLTFTENGTGWIGGSQGAILSTDEIEGTLTSFNDNELLTEHPRSIELGENYPNPFNPVTQISYNLSQAGPVSLKVFTILGEEVATLVNEYKASGKHTTAFNAGQLASGVYIYKLQAGSEVLTRKMTLIK